MSRQVSVMIRAALDSGFRRTFQTADQRVRELNSALNTMRQTAGEMRGLRRVRDDLTALNGTLESQKRNLAAVQENLEKQKSAYRELDRQIERSREAVRLASEEHSLRRQELEKERTAIDAARRPTEAQIALYERLRHELRQAREEKAAAQRQALGSSKILDGRREQLAISESRVMSLASARDAARTAGATQGDIQKLTASLEKERLKARELAVAMGIYEATVRSAAAASVEAAEKFELLNTRLSEQKALLSGQPTAEQTTKLKALEEQLGNTSEALAVAKKEEKSATEAHRDYRKAAIEAGFSVEQLEKKEKEHAAAVALTESQVARATQTSDRHSASLKKQGHNLDNLTDAERRHTAAVERQELALRRREQLRNLSDRSRDLRSQAMSHAFFTLGSGYIFTTPLRDAIEFEKSMIRVKAMSGATSEEYKRLKDHARQLGAETVYSAKEVAMAQNELATAGYRASDMIAIMPSMLALANSSMTGLARTAEITSEVLQGFRIDVSEMKRVGDSLTAAYSSSASSLESLGEMLKYVSAVAVDVNSSLEQTLAASSVLHNTGIKGSMAGTSIRAIFLRLSQPPKELEKMLDQMNVKTKDSANNMRNWIDILHDVNKALKGAGSAKKAEAWKKIGGEDHAPAASSLASAERDGSLRFIEKTLRLSPAFNGIGEKLLSMPDAELQKVAAALNVKVNRAMSGGGMALAISESLKGFKGADFETQLRNVFREVKIPASHSDMRPEEFVGQGKKAEEALKRLQISPLKAMGGRKSNEEITAEIRVRIQTLPMEEQLAYIETFFSRTRTGVANLFREFSSGGREISQLLKALDETLTMKKAEKAFSESTAADLSQVKGDWEDIKISLGESLIPALKDILAWLKPITQEFAKWIKENQGFAKAIMLGVGAMFAFSAAMAAAKFALSGFIDVFRMGKGIGNFFSSGGMGRGLLRGARWGSTKALQMATGGISILLRLLPMLAGAFSVLATLSAGSLLAIGAAIVGVGIGVYYLYKKWSTIWPKIVNVARVSWDFIKTHMSWNPVVLVEKNWEKLVDVFKRVYERVKPYIEKLFPWGDSEVKVSGFGKSILNGIFSTPTAIKVDVPSMPATERVSATGPVTQRNLITVNTTIHLDPGQAAPAQLASRIKGEIQSAFQNLPSFSFLDPVMVS